MTDKQKRFCDEYLIDFNATRAYKTVYTSCKKEDSARKAGSRLLTNVDIKNYIEEMSEEKQKETKITQQMVLDELAKIAFFNIKDIYNENGTLKQINELDDNTAKAISSVKVLQRAGSMKINIDSDRKDEEVPIEHIPEQIIQIRTNDKKGALELLGKHLGMFKERVDFGQDQPFEVNINIVKK